jgi:acetyl-CoA carboxylase carboxyl transferase subunit beta
MAALSSQGDIIIVEKGAEVGFTGRRVIEATFRPQLPDNFQSAEYSLSHGLIDMAVERPELRATLARVLALHRHPTREASGHTHKVEVLPGVGRSRGASGAPAHGNTRTAWETVSLARGMNRPTAQSYLTEIVTDFVELHGDRCFSDDRAIIGGIGFIGGQPVTIIAQEKGTTTSERVSRNFGMPLPEGYRKAIRLARQAEKFGRPVICLVDTQGAHCGVESEDRGQGNAVGDCLTAMSTLRVPVISVILSEGGSGGALAFALANSVGMLENAIYSICSPEAFATILWKAPSRAAEAAEVMRLTAHDALDLAAIDEVIPEPAEGAHTDPHATAEAVGHFILRELEHLMPLDAETLMRKRQQRFRDFLRVEGEHAHEANILNFRTADSEKPELPVAQSS